MLTCFLELLWTSSYCMPLYLPFSNFPGGLDVKVSACNAGDLGQEDPLEKEMTTHSSTLAWKIPWAEEPGWLQFMGLQRVGHDWVTSFSYHPFSSFNLWIHCLPSNSVSPPWWPMAKQSQSSLWLALNLMVSEGSMQLWGWATFDKSSDQFSGSGVLELPQTSPNRRARL